MPSSFLLALPRIHYCWTSGTGYFTNSNSSSFWIIDTFFWMFQYPPTPPPQISPLLHFTPASNLLQINKESCRGHPWHGLVPFILTQQLEGDVKEPVTLFIKSRGRRPRCHGLSDLCRLWMTANMDWSGCIMRLYMLMSDLTSLVPSQFSHWLVIIINGWCELQSYFLIDGFYLP